MCTHSAKVSFSISSIMRRYHECKDVWEATEGEELLCQQENDVYHNPFSVAVVKDDHIVRNVPKNLDSVFVVFAPSREYSLYCIWT